VYATDVSAAALHVAGDNIRRLGVEGRVTLLHGNLLEPVPERPDLVVANLPYLSREMMESLDPDVAEEPFLALAAGETGVELYRELLVQMESRGWDCPAVLEIDPRQSDLMEAMIAEVAPGRCVEIEPDYAGRERIAVVTQDE
jgi:HemK-like putative methylase